ncbi:MAG: cobyric acid synthase CobQ, partial [Sphingomonas sp.]
LAEQRAAWLARLGVDAVGPDHAASIDAALDAIAATLERHVDLDAMLDLAQRAG